MIDFRRGAWRNQAGGDVPTRERSGSHAIREHAAQAGAAAALVTSAFLGGACGSSAPAPAPHQPVQLNAQQQALASEFKGVRGAHVIWDVPQLPQQEKLTCEEASLRMALAHEGIQTSESEILAHIGVDSAPVRTSADHITWGDPYTSFVGDPNGSEVTRSGYGTYYPNIARAAKELGGTVLLSGQGLSADQVYSALEHNHPVEVWVGYDWKYHAPIEDWYDPNGRRIGTWNGPVEHAVTLVGVTPDSVIVNNPSHADGGWTVVPKSTFEAAWATYDNMAVVIR